MPRAAGVLFPVPSSASGPPAHAWRIGVRGLLNVASLALVVAIVAGVADSELLLDAFWVTLVIGAFLFAARRAVACRSRFALHPGPLRGRSRRAGRDRADRSRRVAAAAGDPDPRDPHGGP